VVKSGADEALEEDEAEEVEDEENIVSVKPSPPALIMMTMSAAPLVGKW